MACRLSREWAVVAILCASCWAGGAGGTVAMVVVGREAWTAAVGGGGVGRVETKCPGGQGAELGQARRRPA